jgi:tetratricopeptide (TPR) repeat protein
MRAKLAREKMPQQNAASPSHASSAANPSISERGRLFDALMERAAGAFRAGDDSAVSAALTEAEACLPETLPSEMPWPARAMNLNRARAGLAQKQGRHADAVVAFEAALAAIPSDATGERDALAARLQLYVRLARSRLSLGQAAQVQSEMEQSERIIATLSGKIPSGALDTIRAAVLGNLGSSALLLASLDEAESRFSAGVALIDSIGGAELASLRKQLVEGWASALRQGGKSAEAEALQSGSIPLPRAASCGCGHAHDHHHHHDHGEHRGHEADQHGHEHCDCGHVH